MWAPLRYGNAGFFYGEQENLVSLLRKMNDRPQRDAMFMEVLFLNLTAHGITVPPSKILKEQTWTNGLRFLLEELTRVRGMIQGEAKRRGLLELNRKLSVVIINLDEKSLVELKRDAHASSLLKTLLLDASDERLFFILAAPQAIQLPKELMAPLEWVFFGGAENANFARRLYPENYEEIYNERRALVGLTKDASEEKLMPVHELSYAASAFRRSTEVVSVLEEDTYAKWLNNFPIK